MSSHASCRNYRRILLRPIRTILARGTSAHRQLRTFDEARSGGATQREALQAVVDFLIRETAAGI